MTLWVCGGEGGCGTKYAVGLFKCPRCHNTDFYEDGDPMAKIRRLGGASDKTLPAPEPEPEMRERPGTGEPMQAVEGDELTGDGSGEALPPVPDEACGPDAVPLEGGEGSSPGSSSSASTEKPQTNSEPSSKPRPKRARKTATRSGQGLTESGSASSTDGEKTDESPTADVDAE
jgi:hypothetical protein